MDILDRILKTMKRQPPKEQPKEQDKNKPVCAFCGSTENVKYKGGQIICKKCLRKARKMAKKYTR